MKKIPILLFSLLCTSLYAAPETGSYKEVQLIKNINQCKAILSALDRLDCYDDLLSISHPSDTLANAAPIYGQSAQLAVVQEKTRKESGTTEFILSESNDENPSIIITTPAIGIKPPRPILAFSCIDNITRMQLILPTPLSDPESHIRLITDNDKFDSVWFIRDEGYTFEASRGLPGIQEIQRLFHTNTLTFASLNRKVNGLRFNIPNLQDTIKSLRTACHW